MSSSKTTTGSSSSTSTPTNPAWVDQGLQSIGGQVAGLAGQDPSQFVAGPSTLQQQQFGQAGQIGSTAAGDLSTASGMAAAAGAAPANTYNPATMTAATAAPGIATYMNPYQDSVDASTTKNLNDANQLALNDVDQGAQLAGGYGGSRQGVAEGLTNKSFANTEASTIASNDQAGFNTALQAANADADRQQQASVNNQTAENSAGQFNAQAEDTADNRGLAASGVLGGLATTGLNQLDNSGTAQYGIDQAQAQAPISVAQQIGGAFGSLPLGLDHGTDTTGNSTSTETSSNPMGTIAGLAGLAAAPFTGGASLSLGSMLGGLGAASGGAGAQANGVAGLTGLF